MNRELQTSTDETAIEHRRVAIEAESAIRARVLGGYALPNCHDVSIKDQD